MSFLAEDGRAQEILGIDHGACVGLTWGGLQFVAPFVSSVSLTTIGYIGCRLLGHLLQLVDNVAAFEQVDVAILARLQAEVGMQCCHTVVTTSLIAEDDDMLMAANLDIGQLPCLADFVLGANLVVFQGDVLRGGVV